MEVFAGEPHAPKAVGAPRAGDALYQVSTRCTALTLDAVLTADQGLAVTAMRAVRAVQAPHTVMTTDQSLRVIAERAIAATFAGVAGNAPRARCTLTHLPYEVTKARLELSRAEFFICAAHGDSLVG